jgi:hypothetical protein
VTSTQSAAYPPAYATASTYESTQHALLLHAQQRYTIAQRDKKKNARY